MKPIKQTVYLPVEVEDEYTVPSWSGPLSKTEGYFFTPEQLNEYTQKIIKQALETAAEKADSYIDMNEDTYVEGNIWSEIDEQSITNTFEETFKKFEVI